MAAAVVGSPLSTSSSSSSFPAVRRQQKSNGEREDRGAGAEPARKVHSSTPSSIPSMC